MTLRLRLVLVLMGVVAAGLLISDAVTYTQLRSFLYERLDPQLQVASFTMSRALEATNGIGPELPFLGEGLGHGSRNGAPSQATTSTDLVHGTDSPAGGSAGLGRLSTPTGSVGHAPLPLVPRRYEHGASGLEPAGTVGELVRASGGRFGKSISVIYSGSAPSFPLLPHPLPHVTRSGYTIFSARSPGRAGASYRVIIRPLHYQGLSEVVAIPLSDVNDTLRRLLWIELLVSISVLAALALLVRWIVRRGLRPLDDMANIAGSIAGGELGHRVTPSDDRTEVGRLGEALNIMLGEIEDAFAVRAASEDRLRRFLADASHELRTPLTSIRGYAELYELGAKTHPKDVATSMRRIVDEAHRMGVMVDDLLHLASADHERPMSLGPEDMVPLVEKAISVMQLTTGDHSIELDAPASLIALCDSDRFRQVIDNLLVNAIRHSPDDAAITVTLRLDGLEVVLLVRDHGEGVAEEDTEAIFRPFHRADFARARVEGGAGLGLAIVSAIVQAHGGSVGVRQGDGGGAEFWVRWPAAETKDPPQPQQTDR